MSAEYRNPDSHDTGHSKGKKEATRIRAKQNMRFLGSTTGKKKR